MTDAYPGNGGNGGCNHASCPFEDDIAELRARAKMNDSAVTEALYELREISLVFKNLIAQQDSKLKLLMDRFEKANAEHACQMRSIGEWLLQIKHRRDGEQ